MSPEELADELFERDLYYKYEYGEEKRPDPEKIEQVLKRGENLHQDDVGRWHLGSG